MSDTGKRILFVGGVHGVGKTTLSKTLGQRLSLPHYSAGTLISERKQDLATSDKAVADVSGNQDVLVEALKSLILPERILILDGHFCLLDKEARIQRVSLETFRLLGPIAAIIVHDDPSLIQERLMERDGRQYDVDQIERFQKAEIEHALNVAERFGVPTQLFRSTQTDEAQEFIRSHLLGETES